MAKISEGKTPSKESDERTSELSQIIKTTELGTLESRKSNLKNHAAAKKTPPSPTADEPKQNSVVLTEDCFGLLHSDRGPPQKIKRFTWRNHNKIEVQVITYGARITSIKLPNRKGAVDDVVLGCRDLAGYLNHGDLYLGATIGRVTHKIENSTLAIDGVQYWVQPNDGKDQKNGGKKGFDKIVWEPYVQGNKLILSHTSRHGDEGFPGDLFVRISFELTSKNEFGINIEAVTTKTTIVNLSNLTYFNLAGHQAGPEEIHRHTVTINANCYTVMKEEGNGLPTGEIMNVVHTKNDFQIPIVLKTRILDNGGYDQNFCVNRGVDQGNCFVARALHVPTGRILEIYSNQYGVNFLTANHFGSGLVNIPVEVKDVSTKTDGKFDNIFVLLNTLYQKVADFDYNETSDVQAMRELLRKIQKCEFESLRQTPSAMMSQVDFYYSLQLSEVELDYLRHVKNLAKTVTSTTPCDEIRKVITDMFNTATAMDKITSIISDVAQAKDNAVSMKSEERKSDDVKSQNESKTDSEGKVPSGSSEKVIKTEILNVERSSRIGRTSEKERNNEVCKDGRVHGKNGVVYKRHGGIAFQTQNYPNAIYHKNFPNCVLNPGETYRHSIVYKFWIQGGKPTLWNKRNCL